MLWLGVLDGHPAGCGDYIDLVKTTLRNIEEVVYPISRRIGKRLLNTKEGRNWAGRLRGKIVCDGWDAVIR